MIAFSLPDRATEKADAEHYLTEAERLLAIHAIRRCRDSVQQASLLGADLDRCSAVRRQLGLLTGDFDAAWQEDDLQLTRGRPAYHRLWNGAELKGKKLVVRSLHGLGDAVQMLRYAPLLKSLCASVLYEVPPKLLKLSSYFTEVDSSVSWGDEAAVSPSFWDLQAESMELPYICRTQRKDLPVSVNYLQLPSRIVQQRAQRMGACSRLRVGLVWAGGDWDRDRWIPLRELEALLEFSNVEFWNIQGGTHASDACGLPMRTYADTSEDGILSLAATITNLDVIVTIDTLAAHLAGALGKEVWLMLKHVPDWRWMVGVRNSPWYPSMRLFRQPEPGNWYEVVQKIKTELASVQASFLVMPKLPVI